MTNEIPNDINLFSEVFIIADECTTKISPLESSEQETKNGGTKK